LLFVYFRDLSVVHSFCNFSFDFLQTLQSTRQILFRSYPQTASLQQLHRQHRIISQITSIHQTIDKIFGVNCIFLPICKTVSIKYDILRLLRLPSSKRALRIAFYLIQALRFTTTRQKVRIALFLFIYVAIERLLSAVVVISQSYSDYC